MSDAKHSAKSYKQDSNILNKSQDKEELNIIGQKLDSKSTTDVNTLASAKEKDEKDSLLQDSMELANENEDNDGMELVKKVIAYFFDDDEFAKVFENFAETYCDVFDPASDEMKFEYTEIYHQFVALFEEKLSEYIKDQGSNVQEFYNYVRQAYVRDKESSIVICSEILVATADFDVFVLMMQQTKEAMMIRSNLEAKSDEK